MYLRVNLSRTVQTEYSISNRRDQRPLQKKINPLIIQFNDTEMFDLTSNCENNHFNIPTFQSEQI